MSKIPLLSGKEFSDFTPETFKAHIRSLYSKPQPRQSAAKKKAPPFSWRRNKKGTLILSVRREPKWLTEEEMNQISRESGEPLNLLFLQLKKKEIRLSTQEREDEIKRDIADLPW